MDDHRNDLAALNRTMGDHTVLDLIQGGGHELSSVEDSRDPIITGGTSPFLGLSSAHVPDGKPDNMAVLHIGCGAFNREKLPLVFRDKWREIRLDIDPAVTPDIIATVTDMHAIADAEVDAVYSSHNLEHSYPHEVPLALREVVRVLKPSGFAVIRLPDLQAVAAHVADGNLEGTLYTSAMGPIAAHDILYGHRPSMVDQNLFMAHRTGFTSTSLAQALIGAGFAAVVVQRDVNGFALSAVAYRLTPSREQLEQAQAKMLGSPFQAAVLYEAR